MAGVPTLDSYEMDEEKFLDLLTKLIGESIHLQNNPPAYVPQEKKAAMHVVEVLEPYTLERGGPLKLELIEYKPDRANLIIQYNADCTDGIVTFIGSHLDVVPANPETWDRDPFTLSREGDKLYARGTTDCLGHVAVITELFRQLAVNKPKLNVKVAAVFIASEENNSPPNVNVGIDQLLADGHLDFIKPGPCIWVDASDSKPCIGCCTAMMWSLRTEGRLAHSGLPYQGINSLELAHAVCNDLQKHFYEKYPKHEQEDEYKFVCPSTMKPTQVKSMEGSVNQIPAWTELCGDIRLVPFYLGKDCEQTMLARVEHLNANITDLPSHGPASHYEITLDTGEVVRGKVVMKFNEGDLAGIACNLDSPGYKALVAATEQVLGQTVEPISLGGSLPLVGTLQQKGFDIQITGFGLSKVYHADNEYATLPDLKNGFKILARIVSILSK